MSEELLNQRLIAAKEVARLAGDLIMKDPAEQTKLSYKGKSDVVTLMDVKCENFIKDYLHERFPHDNFLGEESGLQIFGNSGTWIIDPIDGTSNYVHDLPGYTISIAYEEEAYKPLIGVIFSPVHDQLYYAQKGKGSFCNGTQIHVSDTSDIKLALTITCPPLRVPELIPRFMELFTKISIETGDLRDYGSAALHFCYLASGKAEAYLEYGLKYHDVAAGFVLLSEAGGTYSYFEEVEEYSFSGNIIASNKGVHLWYTSAIGEVEKKYSEILSSKKVLL
jgi:myo-inositol-1(or 4)-monophosphatase